MSPILLLAATAWGQTFEVATIKLHPIPSGQPLIKTGGKTPIRISGNRINLQLVPLTSLVAAAYNVGDNQVSGGPDWASGGGGDMYDIEAKSSGSETPSVTQVRLMLQALLAERFMLKLRRSSKELPVYNLVVGKNGSKLKSVAADAPPPAANVRRGTIEQIAGLVSLFLDRPLIDKTGLEGTFDYNLDVAQLDRGGVEQAAVIAEALTAIQDQLGLKAEPVKASLEMLVIEHAEKPTGN